MEYHKYKALKAVEQEIKELKVRRLELMNKKNKDYAGKAELNDSSIHK
jgi:hypothetical protein